jgi:hypothetical protein
MGMLTCPICENQFNSLSSHLRVKHRLTSQGIVSRFPGITLVSQETKESTSKTCKKLGVGRWRKGTTISEEVRLRKALAHPSSVKVGSTFGESTVVELLGKTNVSGRLRQKVKCQCSCGDFFETLDIYLWRVASPRCRKCVSLGFREYKIGEKIDKLTVLGYEEQVARKLVICQCACGNTVKLRSTSLKLNRTNNCGCSPRGHWEGVGDLSLTYYNRTKRGAVKRGFEFRVTIDYLWELYKCQDGLCNLTGAEIRLSNGKTDQSASLDRIDSSKGYIEGNVHWVHKDINLMKMDFNQDRFIELCQMVAVHASRKTPQPSTHTAH